MLYIKILALLITDFLLVIHHKRVSHHKLLAIRIIFLIFSFLIFLAKLLAILKSILNRETNEFQKITSKIN